MPVEGSPNGPAKAQEPGAGVAMLQTPSTQSAAEIAAPPIRADGNGHQAGIDTAVISSAATQPLPTASATEKLGAGPVLLDASGVPIDRRVLSTDELSLIAHKRRRLNLASTGIAMLVLLVLLNVVYSPIFDPAAHQPPRLPDTVSLAEVQPYGVNTFLQKEVESFKKDRTMQYAQNMGAGWIRQQFPWAEIEYRTDPGNPFWDTKNNQSAWDKYDGIVDLAAKYNLRVIARIDSAPAWSHPLTDTLKAPPDSAHLKDFAAFIQTFVARYKGRIAALQIWNEPNLTGEWIVPDPKSKGQMLPVNAADYTTLLKTAYGAAKTADPNIIVLSAPLATTNDTTSNLNELAYLQGMYNAGARPYFDAMSANAYGLSLPPEDPPSPGKLNFRRVELLHNVMVKNGDTDKSVWFNEYGWNAPPANITDIRWGRVTPDQQADYTVRGIEYARRNWPWAGVFTIWYLRQVGDTPDNTAEYYFGMVTPDFAAEPVYNLVAAAATSTEKVAMPGEWGPLSPPVQAGADWHINLDRAAPGGMYVTPSQPGDTLSIPFQGTDVALSLLQSSVTGAYTGTVSARYYVSVDGTSSGVAAGLPRDAQGHAYVDTQPGKGLAEVAVVQGLDAQFRTQKHVLTIQVGQVGANGSGNNGAIQGGPALYSPLEEHIALPGIAAVTVAIHSSYLLFATISLFLLAGIAFCVWGLTLGGRHVRGR